MTDVAVVRTLILQRRPLIGLAAVLVASGVVTYGFWLKLTCQAPYHIGCYSDLGLFWDARDVVSHRFPYLAGSLDANGTPVGGTYEYPVLTGILIWLTSLPADDVTQFLRVNAVLAGVLALVIAVILWLYAGDRVWWWVASPALLLYPLLNWDLPAVLCAVAGFAMMRWPGRTLRWRLLSASAAFGLGFAFKIYPGFFVVPLVLYALLGGGESPDRGGRAFRRESAAQRRSAQVELWAARIKLALETAASAAAVVILVNLPFILLGREGWWASIQFQRLRKADITTNSLWYWGVRPAYGETPAYDALVDRWSPILVGAGFLLVLWAAWKLSRASHTRPASPYPWVQASASLLSVFLLFHKVDSPQYALWLLPFFVLLRVHPLAVLAYVVPNACVGVGFFLHVNDYPYGTGMLMFGVWGQILGLALLTVLFLLSSPARLPDGAGSLHARDAHPSRPITTV